MQKRSAATWFAVLLGLIGVLTFFGPPEQSLGRSVRVVYLHGAWVWAAIAALSASAIIGAYALIRKGENAHRWSEALGRTGLFFWLTYLPISLWAMQANWNGLFLAEPRWRVAIVFGVGGLALQIVVFLVKEPVLTSFTNIVFFTGLLFALMQTEQVMHPESPIFSSGAVRIQVFFVALTLLVMLAAWQMARWWVRDEPA